MLLDRLKHQSRKLFNALMVAIAILVFGHCLGQFSRFVLERGHLFGLVDLFQLDFENTPAAYFNGMLHLFASLLLLVYGIRTKQAGSRRAIGWFGLAILFFYLFVDEVFQIHERFGKLVSEEVRAETWVPMWTVVAAGLVAVIALLFGRFWWTMKPALRRGCFQAGVVFLAGALLMEVVSYFFVSQYGHTNLGYNMLVAVEEALEMIGVAMLIRVLVQNLPLSMPAHGLAISPKMSG